MGCVQSYLSSSRSKEQARILDLVAKTKSDELTRQLRIEWHEGRGEESVILAFEHGDSGKSMVLDQMKRMEGNEYSSAERDAFKRLIVSNVVHCMRTILEALPQLELILSPDLETAASALLSLPRTNHAITREQANALGSLWRDRTIKEALSRGREFGLDRNSTYYFDSIERIAEPSYRPTTEDILRCRVGLTGIMEMSFSARQWCYRVCDMGPQTEDPVGKKYIRGFTDVRAIMFFVNLCDYDRYDKEGLMEPSRMEETISLFGSICDSVWFRKSDIIIFLTHKDEFIQKLPSSPLGDYFSDYKGGHDEYEARKYILNRFKQLDTSKTHTQILAYYISSTDPPENLNAFLIDYFTPRWVMLD